MPPTTCKDLLKEYCFNCTFGGLRYIADDTKHWTERWLWLGLVLLSWYGSGLLIIAAWDAFILSPISFGVETNYIDWDTKMPAVAVCESYFAKDKKTLNKIYSVADMIWTPEHSLDLEEVLKEATYYRGLSDALLLVCHNMKYGKKPDPQCPMSNYSYYANLVRSDCQELLKDCSYNGRQFNCCEYFLPIDTDVGKCFIINSIQVNDPNPYPMVSNLKNNKHSKLRFDTTFMSTMYTLGEDEVPTITTLQSSTLRLYLGHKYTRQLAIKNIENDPLVEETSPEQRACYFHSENKDGLYPFYSYSACTVLCRKKAQLKICNCTDHFMLGVPEEQRCNITGMACLHAHVNHLTLLKPPWATRPGLSCDCLPSCNETEINVIKDTDIKENTKAKVKSTVEVILANLPTERFKRSVVRSRLDLVVSVGGTTGLFLGASLLSFVEFIFYFTVRFVSNIYMEERKAIDNSKMNREVKLTKPIQRNKPIKFQYPYV